MRRRVDLDRDLLESCSWLPLRLSLRDLGVVGLYLAFFYVAIQLGEILARPIEHLLNL